MQHIAGGFGCQHSIASVALRSAAFVFGCWLLFAKLVPRLIAGVQVPSGKTQMEMEKKAVRVLSGRVQMEMEKKL